MKKVLIIAATMLILAGCKVLTVDEAKAIKTTLLLNKKGFEKTEKGEKVDYFVIKKQIDAATKLIEDAIDE